MATDEHRGSETAERRGSQASGWSVNLGKVAGIPIRLHFTFLLLLAWVAYASGSSSRLHALLYVIGLFACVVLHELGHSLVAQRYGIRVSEIVLYPIGGVARMEKQPRPSQELWIALAGPAVNVVIAVAVSAALVATGGMVPWRDLRLGGSSWWQELVLANVVLFAFNMVPAFPMDGGRVLRSLMAMTMGDARATEIAARIGQLLAIAFGLLGLMFNPIWLLIALFIFVGAGQEASLSRGRALVEGVPVREAMVTDFRVLPVGSTLADAASLLLTTSQHDFPVVSGSEVVGVLDRQALMRGLAQDGPTAYVAGAMSRDVRVTQPDAGLQDVAVEMRAGQVPCMLVMDQDRLVGIVTMENLAELLVVRQLLQQRRPVV